MKGQTCFFRGQSNSDWMIQSTFERVYGNGGKSDSVHGPIFVENSLRSQERFLLTQFIRDGWKYKNDNFSGELSKIEWYSLMRHYGIPTRMVDFTESALIALYFALSDCDAKHDFSVWCVNRNALGNVEIQREINKTNAIDYGIDAMRKMIGRRSCEASRESSRKHPGIYYNAISAISANEEFAESILGDEIDNPKIKQIGLDVVYFFPKHRNARMSAQAGLFLMPTLLSKSFMESLQGVGNVTTDVSASKDIALSANNIDLLCVDPIVKFDFTAKLKDEGRKLLQMANITPRTVYPDIEGIAKELRGEF